MALLFHRVRHWSDWLPRSKAIVGETAHYLPGCPNVSQEALLAVPLLWICASLAASSVGYGQSLQIDYYPQDIEQMPHGRGPLDAVAGSAPGYLASEGHSLHLQLERANARPGERWIDCRLVITPQVVALQETRLVVKLWALGGAKPLDMLDVVPQRKSSRLEIDLRSHGLEKAELSVELLEEGRRTGLIKVFLTASPENRINPGARIPIIVDVPANAGPLKQHPVTFGVPFPAGALWDESQLRLVDRTGREIRGQKEVTGRWAREGSIQWVRFDALVTPDEGCFVEAAPPRQAVTDPVLRLRQADGKIHVDTGAAQYVLAPGVSPIEEISIGGQLVATSAGTRGLYVVDQRGRLASASAEGETMLVESQGPLAACVRFEGFYRTSDGDQLARHITRIECIAGQPMARVTHTFVLTNDSNEVWFTDIGWEFAVMAGAAPRAVFASSLSDSGKHEIISLSSNRRAAFMLQDSHYYFAHGTNHFSIATVDRDGRTNLQAEGGECGSWAALVGDAAGLQLFCRDAARQHPKEFEVFGDRVVLKLFSGRAGDELDFRSPTLIKKWDLERWTYESPTPARKDPAAVKSFVEAVANFTTNAIGWAKTHELVVSPLPAENAIPVAIHTGHLHQERVYARADPAWINASKAMGPMYPRDPVRFPELEAAQEAAIQYWIRRDAKWGENGFIDYCAGPHLVGSHRDEARFYPAQFRYVKDTYTLRGNLWRLWVRSGDRTIRDFAAGSIGAQIDNVHMHWDPPADSSLVRGLFRVSREPGAGLPFYWGSEGRMEISSSSDFTSYLHYYHLTGYRRAREVVEQYAAGIKASWSPARAQRTFRILMLHRLLVQSYALTWDERLRGLAIATADLFEDPDGALLLTKDRPYRSTSYKTGVDVRGIIEAARLLGTPRLERLARGLAEHHWRNHLGSDGFGDYNDGSFVLGHFLYEQTGEPMYAQGVAVTARNSAASYDPVTRTFPKGHIDGAHKVTNIFELDYALDVLTRSGAWERDLASWMSFDPAGEYAAVYVQKPDDAGVELYFRAESRESSKNTLPAGSTYGATDAVRLGVPLGRKNESGQDVNSVWQTSMGNGKVVLPKDAPPLVYPIYMDARGRPLHLFASRRVPLVLHAPGAWFAAPLDHPRHPRKERPVLTTFRHFFLVPAEAEQPQIHFEGAGRLYYPDGTPFRAGEAQSGWISLPQDRPGIWAFEGVVSQRVQVKNIPPFFAVGSAENFFVPDVPWHPSDDRAKPLHPGRSRN
jgi:hypothetical protein